MKTGRSFLYVFLCVACGLLYACGPVTIRDSASQTFIPIQGWTLELHKDVIIPAGRTRVFFQSGNIVPAINEYEPHCQLRVYKISGDQQTVFSDTFSIESVYGTVQQIVVREPVRVAALGDVVLMAGGGDGDGDGDSPIAYFYYMALKADSQPNVNYWVCGGALRDPAFAEYPTLQEVRASMGGYASLAIPAD